MNPSQKASRDQTWETVLTMFEIPQVQEASMTIRDYCLELIPMEGGNEKLKTLADAIPDTLVRYVLLLLGVAITELETRSE